MVAEMTQRAAVERAWRHAEDADAAMLRDQHGLARQHFVAASAWARIASQLEFARPRPAVDAVCSCTIDMRKSVVVDAEQGCPLNHRRGDPAGNTRCEADTEVIRMTTDHEFAGDTLVDRCGRSLNGRTCDLPRAAHVTPGQGSAPGKWCHCDAHGHGHLRAEYCS